MATRYARLVLGRAATAAACAGLLLAAAGCGRGQPAPIPATVPVAAPALDAWPTYGADLASTAAEVTAAASGADAAVSLNLDWTAPADGAVTGEPVVAGDRAYFGTWGDSVYCVDRLTGAVIWRTPLGAAHPDGPYGPFPRIQNSPVLDGGRVFVAESQGRLDALDAATGRILWRSAPLYGALVPNVLRSAPRAYAGVLYVGIGGLGDLPLEWGGVAAINEESGKALWVRRLADYQGGGAAVYGTPALWPEAGLLFVATGNPVITSPQHGAAYSDCIVALRLADGTVAWSYQTHADDMHDLDFIAAPNAFRLADGRVLVGAGEKDANYYAVDARTGALVWQRHLGRWLAHTFILATAASGDGLLYLGTEDVSALTKVWPVNYAKPATGRMLALDPATGRVVWSRALGAALPIPPAVVGQDVFVLDAVGGVHVLDARTGATRWHGSVGGHVLNASAGVTVVGDTLLLPLSAPASVVGLHITWTSSLARAPASSASP